MSQSYYPPPPPQQYPPPPQQYPPPQQPYYPPTYSPVPGAEYASYQPPTYEPGQGSSNPIAEKWNPRPKYQDLWALLLYLIQLVGFLVLSYLGIKEFSDKNKSSNSTEPAIGGIITNKDIHIDTKVIVLLFLTLVLGFVLSLIYMLLMQKFPKPLIKVTLWLSVATFFILAIIYGILKQYVLAVILAIFGVVYLICAWSWRDRIPFAAIMLETVTSITKKYYGTIIMGFAGLFLQMGFFFLCAVTALGAYQKFYRESECSTVKSKNNIETISCKSPGLYLVLLFLVFSFYWTSQVITTIVHVTNSGVFAAFYFLEGTPQGTGPIPTLSSLKRSCTTSLGSICFGSLIIAILNTLKAIFRALASSDDGACGFLACCFAYLLACIENLVEYFNHYAYVQVAIYGKSYCRAAKDTWTLIKDRGVEAIINDNLIGNVLTMGAIFIGLLCGLFGYAYITLTKQDFNTGGQYSIIFGLIVLGYVMTSTMTDAIYSGVSTTFVALAEDPDALKRTKPELFERIRQQWPRVVQGV